MASSTVGGESGYWSRSSESEAVGMIDSACQVTEKRPPASEPFPAHRQQVSEVGDFEEHVGHPGIYHPDTPSTRDAYGSIIPPDRAQGNKWIPVKIYRLRAGRSLGQISRIGQLVTWGFRQ